MGKFVNSTYMTLDGDTHNMEDWHFDYFDDHSARAATAQLFTAEALIMGRETYEGFADVWTSRAGVYEFSDRMNSIKKYVVSTTLTDPTWTNTTVIGKSDDVVAELRELKEQHRAIVQYGYGPVTRLMLANNLLDELRIWLHPVLSGKAKPEALLYRDLAQTRFTLGGVESHASGVVILTYLPTPTA